MRAFIVAFTWVAAAAASAATTTQAVRVPLKGLVCSFCARGLSEVLKKQKAVDHFEIHLAKGEVLLWGRDGQTPAPTEIQAWVEKAGLKVAN